MRRPSAQIAAVVSEVLRALSFCAPIACLDVPTALAQPAAPTSLTADIPGQPLSKALAAFASQTGLQLIYVSEIVRGQQSHLAAAGLTPQAALGRLLQGTGLRFEFLTAQSVRILAVAASPQQTSVRAAALDEPGEVIVTANRRTESLQDVPESVQVLTGYALAQLHATTFEDFGSHLPGLTAHGTGPGQNSIYVRGLGTGENAVQGAGFASNFPNVGVYLDEQSVQFPGRNLDVYAVLIPQSRHASGNSSSKAALRGITAHW